MESGRGGCGRGGRSTCRDRRPSAPPRWGARDAGDVATEAIALLGLGVRARARDEGPGRRRRGCAAPQRSLPAEAVDASSGRRLRASRARVCRVVARRLSRAPTTWLRSGDGARRRRRARDREDPAPSRVHASPMSARTIEPRTEFRAAIELSDSLGHVKQSSVVDVRRRSFHVAAERARGGRGGARRRSRDLVACGALDRVPRVPRGACWQRCGFVSGKLDRGGRDLRARVRAGVPGG